MKLSNREKQIITFVADGRTAKEIGKILNISNRTVETYIQNAREKCNCRNKIELVKLFVTNMI